MSLAHLVILPCPNGRAANGAWRYSLYLAPRLRETGSLGNYEIWRNWGQRVANLQFRVFVGNGQTATPVTITSPAVDPAVWAAVFGGNPQEWSQVTVEPFTFVDRTDTALFGDQIDTVSANITVTANRFINATGRMDGHITGTGTHHIHINIAGQFD